MRVEELERELRAERAEPDPEFARELDEWAAAGFPRRGNPGALERLRSRFATAPPRRMILRVGAVATAVVVAGVAISHVDLSGEVTPSSDDSSTALQTDGGAGGGKSGSSAGPAASPPAQVPASPPAQGESATGAADEYELAPGVVNTSRASEEAPFAAGSGAVAADSGGKSVQVGGRKRAQKVDLSLATAPADFRDAADQVLAVVAVHNGFVLESTVSGGDPSFRGAQLGQANFKLKIPAGQLQSALAQLSELGHVVSRTDGSEDITGRFISAKRRIADYTEARQKLLAQLEDAVTLAEQQSIRARLRIVEAQLDEAQGDLASAKERVHLVPVTVSIAADTTISGDGDSDDSGWSLSDALRDAGDVLTVMAGIGLVSLAVLVPLALVGLLLWWVAARIQRWRREAALDQSS